MALLFFVSLAGSAGSRADIDRYNEATVALLDDLDSALQRVDYTIELAENMGYSFGQGYALYLKGYIHRMQDDLGKSFLSNLKGLTTLQDSDDERALTTLVRLYLNTGEILEKHFKYEEAVQYYDEGLALAKKGKLKRWIVDLSYNAGYAYFLKGDLDSAVELINKCYQLAQETGDEYTVVNALNLMGLAFRDNKDYDTAALFFNKMLEYPYEDLDADKYKGRAYHNLANTYAHASDTTKALEAFRHALVHKKVRGMAKELFITEFDFAETLYLLGAYEEADMTVQRCIENYSQMRLYPDYYKVFDLARKINASLGRYRQADQYASRYVTENLAFINQQEELIAIRDQFKMELLTASFFGELERNKRITQLSRFVLWISVLAIVLIAYLKIKQIRIEKVVERAVGELSRYP